MDVESVRTWCERVQTINTPDVIGPLLGFFSAAVIKPEMRTQLGAFPILQAYGTQGSGKTSLLECLCAGFCPSHVAFSTTNTPLFSLGAQVSSSTTFPVHLSELKLTEWSKCVPDFHTVIKNSYDGNPIERAKLGILSLSSPVVICGEEPLGVAAPRNSAVAERMVFVRPTKTSLKDPVYVAAFEAISRLDVARSGVWLALQTLVPLVRAQTGCSVEEARERARDKMRLWSCSDIRTEKGLATLIYGYELWLRVLQELGVPDTLKASDTDLVAGTMHTRTDLGLADLDAGFAPISPDQLLILLGQVSEAIEAGCSVTHPARWYAVHDAYLAIHVKGMLGWYKELRREERLVATSESQVYQFASEAEYVHRNGGGSEKFIDEGPAGRKRGIRIDIEALRKLDLDLTPEFFGVRTSRGTFAP